MRTLTGGAMALAASVVLVSTAHAQSAKIAFVDGQRIFGSVPGRAEAEAQFNKEMDSVRATEKVMGDSMSALIANYSKAEATLSAADKTTQQQSIRDKQAAFQQKQQQLEQKAQERQNELVRPILDKIHRVIDDIRAENGYTMVVDVSPNAGGSVVSYDKNLDITDNVIRKLQSMPSTTATTPTSPTRPSGGARPTPSGVTQPKPPSN
ncbi:MAG TPA: OmpH family outer membrane protein [Gemmatimonadaceae bacterium]|nr:OmpH family outer membrane protein [Gemmatimonadaceae bacterium]